MSQQIIGKVRATRSGQKMVVEAVEVGGAGVDGRFWHDIVRHDNGVVRCDCAAWKFQRKAPADRVCKHMMKLSEAVRSGVTRSNDVIVLPAMTESA